MGQKCCDVGWNVIECKASTKGVEERIGMAEEAKETVDLYGEYRFKVDAKGRMSLPAKFRKVLSTELVVTPSPDDECLYVFDEGEFDKWVAQLFDDRFGGYVSTNKVHQGLKRKLNSRAADVQVDAAGRIMLAAKQRECAGMGKDVVIVGNTGYFEVWDAKRYDEMDAQVDLDLLFSQS